MSSLIQSISIGLIPVVHLFFREVLGDKLVTLETFVAVKTAKIILSRANKLTVSTTNGILESQRA